MVNLLNSSLFRNLLLNMFFFLNTPRSHFKLELELGTFGFHVAAACKEPNLKQMM